jgi:hypothetical protein
MAETAFEVLDDVTRTLLEQGLITEQK